MADTDFQSPVPIPSSTPVPVVDYGVADNEAGESFDYGYRIDLTGFLYGRGLYGVGPYSSTI